jgi:hypothetical protein
MRCGFKDDITERTSRVSRADAARADQAAI